MNDFEKGFLTTFIAYWIGSKIDQTRFGIWFNNNRTIDIICQVVKRILLLAIIGLVMYYFYLVGVQMLQ